MSPERRLISCPSIINKNKANIEARLARHAKLEIQDNPVSSAAPVASRTRFFAWPIDMLQHAMGVDQSHSGMSRLVRRIVAISVVFFVLSSFGPMYDLTEGNVGYYEDVNYIDFANGPTDSILADIMTEDGFILKPALNSTEGDRSTANEIFAYEVESGDTISSLAQRFGIKKETIAMENDLYDTNRLRTGMVLKILPVDGVSHVVKKGETVDKIADKYDVSAEDIVRQNQLEDEEALLADTALIIPGGKRSITTPTVYANAAPATTPAPSYSGGGGRLIWPSLGAAKLTQGFHAGHYAIDIANRAKGPIFAAAAGKVVKASYGWNGGYGNVVIIDHGNGMQTLYGHNEKLYVTEGQYVDQGQTISWMGRSGRVYGPTGIHVHFEVRINGVKYNPMNFF